jgi:hypothetical protein
LRDGRITPGNAASHNRLEREVTDWLAGNGFLVGSATYHTAFPAALASRIRSVDSPTALLARGRSDKLACHSTLPLCFHFELKTAEARPGQDFMPELVQLATHLAEWERVRARTLYIFRNGLHDPPFDSCFWVDGGLPRPSKILIGRGRLARQPWLESWALHMARPWWPGIGVEPCNMSNSGDPCLRIPAGRLPALDYRAAVLELVDSFAAPGGGRGTLPLEAGRAGG